MVCAQTTNKNMGINFMSVYTLFFIILALAAIIILAIIIFGVEVVDTTTAYNDMHKSKHKKQDKKEGK